MNTIKLWRLLKVIYFIITIPIVIGGRIWIAISQEIYRWNNYVTVNDYYIGILYAIIFVVSYIITTDIIRRIISYINHGNFKGFIPYAIILKKYLLKIIIGGIIISIILVALSQKMRNECTWENEEFNEQGICTCKVWYEKSNLMCIPTIGQKIHDNIPTNSLLREYREVPWKKGLYVGIYINDYRVNEVNWDREPYMSCPEETEWQWITWEYHIFSYWNEEIISDIQIPSPNQKNEEMIFPYMNTKTNNSKYFFGDNPRNKKEEYLIEQTTLINFQDYNWDWVKNEFLLVNWWDQVCGHKNYMIVGLNQANNEVMIYEIESKNHKIIYWWDNFVPNEKWEVKNWYECWDHGTEIGNRNFYKYDPFLKKYIFLKDEEIECK